MNDAAGDDGGHGCAFEGAGVERRVAGFAGGLLYVVGPFAGGGKNGEVGGLAGGDLAFDAEDARGSGGEEFDHAHEREAARVDELFERKRDGGFKAKNAEGGSIELDVLESGLVRGVIGGDGVDGAVGEARDEGFAVFAGG